MRHLRAIIEAWLKNRVWSVYDAHGRAYLVLGGIAWAALGDGATDPWVVRSSVWGVVLLALSATAFAAWTRRAP